MYDNLFYHQATLLTQEQCLWDVDHYMENNSLACLYQCTFDKESFDLSVAERLNIEIPDSVLRSVNKRQAEFTAGRYMAQLCIETLSNMHCSIPIGSHREPLWPECLTGAISHTDNQAIALVAKQPSYQFVGLDIETNIEKEVAQQICRDVYDADECAIVSKQGLSLEVTTTVIFSAKESLFKALFSYVGRFFGFECARVIELNETNNSIVLMLDKGLSRYCSGKQIFKCRYFIHASKVITIILE